MRKAFASKMAKLRKYTTPGTPGQGIVRPKEGEPKIGATEQTEYQSGVGMLLFLVKYSRPDIANAVRELSKVNDGTMKAYQKELLRLIKFVVDTKDWMLKYELKDESKNANKWVLKAFCDSDFAGDKDNRLSVAGYGVYIYGCLVVWKSRALRTHALSSTEAEYLALSEVCCEILFIKQLLEFFGRDVEYPIIIHCDNVGAIYLAHNAKNSRRTTNTSI